MLAAIVVFPPPSNDAWKFFKVEAGICNRASYAFASVAISRPACSTILPAFSGCLGFATSALTVWTGTATSKMRQKAKIRDFITDLLSGLLSGCQLIQWTVSRQEFEIRVHPRTSAAVSLFQTKHVKSPQR